MKSKIVTLSEIPKFSMQLHEGVDQFVSAGIESLGVWEPYETEVVRSLLHKGANFLDLGANIGWYTVIASLLVGESGHVISFEPDPDNFSLLSTNVAENNLKNVTLINAAAGAGDGVLKLYKSVDNLGDHRLYPADEDREAVDVNVMTLDSYFTFRDIPIDLIKLDTQGSEVAIFEGFIKRFRDIAGNASIITEFWPYGLDCAGSSATRLLDILTPHVGDVFIIDEPSASLIPTTIDELCKLALGPFRPETKSFMNLLMLPK